MVRRKEGAWLAACFAFFFRSDLCCSTFSADDVKLAGEENGTGSVRSRTAAEQVERAMKRSRTAKQCFLAGCKTAIDSARLCSGGINYSALFEKMDGYARDMNERDLNTIRKRNAADSWSACRRD